MRREGKRKERIKRGVKGKKKTRKKRNREKKCKKLVVSSFLSFFV